MSDPKRITARDITIKTDAEITKIAREILLDQCHLGTNEESIRYSFALILMQIKFTDAAAGKIGALYGTPMKGAYYCNGNPLCGDMGWLHKKDMPRLAAEIKRMQVALGLKVEE